MDYYTEYRRLVKRVGPPQFVHLDDLPTLTGFRGVYAVQRETAEAVVRFGNVSALTKSPVWSDTLFIDYDGEEGSETLEEDLSARGIGHSVWSTGRRGVHFHIPTEPIYGSDVPARHLDWVQKNADGCWDKTLYRATSIFRLPGTWHEKSAGKRKVMVREKAGKRLEIPRLTPGSIPSLTLSLSSSDSLTPSSHSSFYTRLMQKAPQRNAHVFFLGKLSKQSDVPYHEALDAVRWWAEVVCKPALDIPDAELERQFNNGRRVG